MTKDKNNNTEKTSKKRPPKPIILHGMCLQSLLRLGRMFCLRCGHWMAAVCLPIPAQTLPRQRAEVCW